ncbi:hypothetical protein BH23CHL2_BH23CHL2_30610 [soil metagenome]
MAKPDERPEPHADDELFDDIREYLAEQSGDQVYEELSRAYRMALGFAQRELIGRPEYTRMLRGIDRLLDDIIGARSDPELKENLAEVIYLYGLAHYSILQQLSEDGDDADIDEDGQTARPLIVYDIWFPDNIGIENTDDGYFLHIGDGRIDVSVFLGLTPNERGALVDLVDHWEYATANTQAIPRGPDLSESVPMMAIEMDYAGSELVDANDHVDVLLFDHRGEPLVRVHARDSDLRAIVDEIQAILPPDDSL